VTRRSALRKWSRPSIVKDDGAEFRPTLFTAEERARWVSVPASYLASLGDALRSPDEHLDDPEPEAIPSSRPWEYAPATPEEPYRSGPRPPHYAGPYGWLARASCASVPIDFTHPANLREADRAFRVCAACPVVEECRHFAEVTETEEPPGVWANVGSYHYRIGTIPPLAYRLLREWARL
jgi:hypothetical protein